MKSIHFWIIIAVLLGAAVFGIFKSFELAFKNASLRHTLEAVQIQLAATEKSLASTRAALGESYLKNAELEGRLIVMDKKVEVQAEAIKAHLAKISVLSSKLQETARANARLSARNQEIAHELFKERLDADKMREKLSSISELKRAIAELKNKVVKVIKREPIPELEQPKLLTKKKKDLSIPGDGNEGYLVKDGKSTYVGWVDVTVVPTDSAPISE